MNLRGDLFLKYRLQDGGWVKFLKTAVSEHLWAVNMLKAPKHSLNLHGSVFVIYFDAS